MLTHKELLRSLQFSLVGILAGTYPDRRQSRWMDGYLAGIKYTVNRVQDIIADGLKAINNKQTYEIPEGMTNEEYDFIMRGAVAMDAESEG